MLTNSKNIEIAEVFKNYKGWGSTHANRELFEELYRAFNKVSTESILTYGSLIPRTPTDALYNNVVNLAPNTTYVYPESNFNKVPLIEYVAELPLTAVSGNCNDAFVIARDGKQVENIIPFDFSDTGIYNYTLKTANGEEIAFGVCDWRVDVNASILTFNNGVPEGVSAAQPPKLTFYRYAGPTGIKSHLDAVFKTVAGVPIKNGEPVVKFTDAVSLSLEEVNAGWFDKFGFNGSDTTQGIGLQFNVLTPVKNSATGDVLKGWDAESNSQVVSLLSHKVANNENVLFVSEGLSGTVEFVVNEPGLQKVDLDDGFVVGEFEAGDYSIEVTESKDIFAVLLAKNNETLNYDLYITREDDYVDVQVPLFVDVSILPAHLKLTAMTSYGDQIVPQYYGPRVVDFVIAAETTKDNRSADFIVYNETGSYLADGLAKSTGHTLLRNGSYLSNDKLTSIKDIHIQGESKLDTQVAGSFEVTGTVVLSDLDLSDATITVAEDAILELNNVNVGRLDNRGTVLAFNSNIDGYLDEINSSFELHNSYVGKCSLAGKGLILSSHIGWLDSDMTSVETVIESTAVDYLNSYEGQFKLDFTYITEVGDNVNEKLYPAAKTISYYNAFNERFFAKLPDPIDYDADTNEIIIKLDLGEAGVREPTIFINEDGRLQVRIFKASEIRLNSDRINTQVEDVYGQHADTVLETDKPENVEDAIVDLYWSKADLVKGKIPIDQLPDSVASGGLSFVGMWSFEKHAGEYPTFADVDFSVMSDDNYTGLQRGWFFIVDSSDKEDDPAYPQVAIDGVEYTAGDWIVCCGKNDPAIFENVTAQPLNNVSVVRKDAHTLLQYKEGSNYTAVWSSGQQYGKNKKVGLSTVMFFADHADLYKSDDTGFHFVETYPVEYVEGIFDKVKPEVNPYKTLVRIKIGDYSFKVNGTAVRNDNNKYDQLDTQYVYKEDYVSGNTSTIARLLLVSEDDETEAFAEEVFGAIPFGTSNGFCLRPTMVKGWWGDNHYESTDVLDNIDYVYSQQVRAYASASLTMSNRWEKVDRAFSDPVMSRLPEKAPVTNGPNVAWSIEDGGTGRLNLSYKTLAEALRLINEELFNLGPQTPASIKDIILAIDEKITTGKVMEYRPAIPGQLEELVANFDAFKKEAFVSGSGEVVIKQLGVHNELPLEREFYVSDDYDFEVLDGTDSIYSSIGEGTASSTEIKAIDFDVQDPYVKYRLGISGPSKYKAADVKLTYDLICDSISAIHKLTYAVTNQGKNPYVKDLTEFEGTSQVIEFEERKPNDFGDTEIGFVSQINAAALNAALQRVGGVKALVDDFSLVGEFNIKNFISNGAISRNDKVVVRASLGNTELELTELSQTLVKTSEGVFDLKVRFTVVIPNKEEVYGKHDLVVSTDVFTYEDEILDQEVLRLIGINIAPKGIKEVLLNSPMSQYPVYGTDFGNKYIDLTSENSWELVYGKDGWSWPENTYVDSYSEKGEADLLILEPTGFLSDEEYRFVTIKKSLEEIYDLCGFDLLLEYGNENLPTINKLNGQFESLLVQVLARSSEQPNTQFLDGNKAVPIFYKSNFEVGAPALYPGKSNETTRRITFGNVPVAVDMIIVRIGIPKDSNICIKNVDFNLNIE